MKAFATILTLCVLSAAFAAAAQDVSPPPGMYGQMHGQRMRELSPEQREQVREARQQRRDTWQQMSPEDRHQLRRDIRDAGQTLYPRGRRQRPD
jgi:hypothetical protein